MASTATTRVFRPDAIRTMATDDRRALQAPTTTRAAEVARREQLRCYRPSLAGLTYFVRGYGSIEPPRGDPQPFRLWPCQVDVLRTFWQDELVVVLKSRRLGLSWLALHFAVWLLLFGAMGPAPRIVLICKNDDDAKKLLARCRRIIDRLPYYLRPCLDVDNVRALGVGGGEIMALPATAGAARQETATLFILDEFAFPQNGVAGGIWTGVVPTIEGGGKGIVISTGNGREGDGAAFAHIYDSAAAGIAGTAIFLPWQARPGRSIEWRDAQRRRFLYVSDFEAEYPETPEQALQAGVLLGRVFRRDSIVLLDRPLRHTAGRVRGWDLAATDPKERKSGDPDYTVGVLLERDLDTGRPVVADVVRERVDPTGVEELIRRTMHEDGPNVTQVFEQEPGAAGKLYAAGLVRRLGGLCPIIVRTAQADKVTKARNVAIAAGNGVLCAMRGPWLPAFLGELDSFPGAGHDDQVDALAIAYRELPEYDPTMVVAKQPLDTSEPSFLTRAW